MSATLPANLDEVFGEIPGVKTRLVRARRLRVDLDAETLPTLLELLKGRAGYLHLSAISCVDWPQTEEFELIYQLWSYETHVLISAHVRIPKDPGSFVSVYDIHIPAAYFERDIHEMFGLRFEGAPDLRPFVLTEWNGPPPMLKSFSSIGYVEETYDWQQYRPDWLSEVEAKGGGVIED